MSQSPARPVRLRIHVTVSSGGAVLSKDDVEFIQTRVAEAKVAMLKELEAMYDDNGDKANNAAADKASGGLLARLKAAATSRPAVVGAMTLALAGGAFAAHKTGYLTLEQARVLAELGRVTGRRLAAGAAGVRAGVRSARNKAAARLAKGWAWASAQAKMASNAVFKRFGRSRVPPPPPQSRFARFASRFTSPSAPPSASRSVPQSASMSSLAAKLGLAGRKKK
jgi:hypothetical protein